MATPLTLTSSAKILATASGNYADNGNSNNNGVLVQVQLLDNSSTVVAVSQDEVVYEAGGNIPVQFGVGGVLRQGISSANPAFIAAPGTYTLLLNAHVFGLCSSTNMSLRGASLTYMILAN